MYIFRFQNAQYPPKAACFRLHNIDDILNKNKSSETFKCFDIAKQMNASITANGTLYSNEKRGFLPDLMDKMYGERKMFKDKMIESKKKLEEINAELSKRGLKV